MFIIHSLEIPCNSYSSRFSKVLWHCTSAVSPSPEERRKKCVYLANIYREKSNESQDVAKVRYLPRNRYFATSGRIQAKIMVQTYEYLMPSNMCNSSIHLRNECEKRHKASTEYSHICFNAKPFNANKPRDRHQKSGKTLALHDNNIKFCI